MYNTDYVLTYYPDHSDPDNEVKYRDDILGVFKLDQYDDDVINNNIVELCKTYASYEKLNKIIRISKEGWFSDDDEIGLMGLFAFDYFFHLHHILVDIINNQAENSTHFDTLYYNLIQNNSK